MVSIKVGDIKNVPWKKTKATLSIMLTTNLGVIIIKDCRLIDGVNGMYVAGPSKKYQNKENEDVYFQFLDLDKQAQDSILKVAHNAYDMTKEDYKVYDAFPRKEYGDGDNSIPF
jgi:DNA-binding cell septation regulator SpoVG